MTRRRPSTPAWSRYRCVTVVRFQAPPRRPLPSARVLPRFKAAVDPGRHSWQPFHHRDGVATTHRGAIIPIAKEALCGARAQVTFNQALQWHPSASE